MAINVSIGQTLWNHSSGGDNSSPSLARFADIDRDGDLDIFVGVEKAAGSQGSQVWKNDGAGNFTLFQTLTPMRVVEAWLVNIDGDADLELITREYDQPVKIWQNNGSGLFTYSSSTTGNVNDAAVGDLDGDNDLDIFVARKDSNTYEIYKNNGSGSFSLSSTVASGTAILSVALADLNKDGDLDVVAYEEDNGRILTNNGSGTFASTSTYGDVYGIFVNAVDVTGDGYADVFTSGVTGSSAPIRLYRNDGTGGFGTELQNFSALPTPYTFGDVDGDGDVDGFSSAILLNSGSGVFTNSGTVLQDPTFPLYDGSAVDGSVIGAGDVDGDGDLDLAVSFNSLDWSTYTYQSRVKIFINNSATTNSDGSLSAGFGVAEPVGLAASADTAAEAVNVFDFRLTDGGGGDGVAMGVSSLVVHTSGTGDFSKVTWRLSGPDATNVTGTYSSGGNTITFAGLSISVADAGTETYTVNAFFNNTTGLAGGETYVLSVDGDTDVNVTAGGTRMASGQTAVNNGSGTVVSANTAPTITATPSDVTVTEDTASNVDLSAVTVADVDGNTLTITLTASVGTLAASSGGSVTVGGTASALTLTGSAANINTFLDTTSNIQYTGASNANGNNAATLTLSASDGTTGFTSNPVVNLDITAVNDAPTMTGGASLAAIAEDVVSLDVEDVSDTTNNPPPNWGDDIATLLTTSGFADVDEGTTGYYGIAIAADASNPTTQGKWQYSNDPNTEYWHDIGTVSTTAALLLSSNGSYTTFLRFVPVANFGGTPGGLTIHAVDSSTAGQTLTYTTWDGTAESRHTFNTTTDDATSSVSASGVSWSVSVSSVNDAPVISNLAADSQIVAASASAVVMDQGTAASIVDVDNANFNGGSLTVSFVTRTDGSGDVLSIQTTGITLSNGTIAGSTVTVGSTLIGTIAASGTGTGTDNLIVDLNSSATPALVATLLQNISYDNTAGSPTAGARTVRFVLTDGSGDGSGNIDATVTVTTNPTVAITSSASTVKAGDTPTITFTFSETPTGFANDDVTVSGGSLSTVTVDGGDNKIYTATFTPTANTQSLSAAISVIADRFTNSSSQNNLASTTNVAITGDTLAPTLATTSSVSALKAGETATVTFTFSEDPGSSFAWDGTTGAVVVTGGTLGSISGTGLTRTATFTPTSSTNGGTASITVAPGTYTDAAGNNGGAGTTPSLTFDTLAPTLTITSSVSALKAGETATVTFTFSEDPGSSFAWDGTNGAVVVTGGTLGSISGTGLTRTATFTPTTSTNGGTGSITVAASTYTDAAGNNGDAGTTPTLTFDTLAPTLTISTVATDDKINGTEDDSSVTIEGTSVGADGQTVSASVAGGTAKTATVAAGGAWSVSLTSGEAQALTQGNVSITADVADAAGNAATQASKTVVYDRTDPTLGTITRATLSGPTGSSTFTIDVAYADTGSGLDSSSITTGDITVTGPGAVGTLTVSGVSYTAGIATYTVNAPGGTWSAASHAGNYTVALAAGEVKDLVGNSAAANASAHNFAVSFNTAPSITSNGAGAIATISHAEMATAVTTVLASDIDVGDTLAYSLTGGADQLKFSINSSTGALAFVTSPDVHTPTDSDANNSYLVEVTANDGHGGTDMQALTVTVLSDIDRDGTVDISDTDMDNDGRLNSAEDPVPNASGSSTGDGNGDGTPDREQINVASIATLGTASADKRFATIEVASGLTLTNIANVAAPGGLPRNVKMPLGQFDFDIGNVTIGSTVSISMYVDKTLGMNGYYKFNGTTWTNIATATTVDNKTKLTFSLTDGGLYDADGIANGIIKDPGGAALVAPAITSNGGNITASVNVAENSVIVATVVSAIPPTLANVAYSISGGADASKFNINPTTGALSFTSAPNFEAPTDTGADNSYEVIVQAIDDQGGSDTQTLTVTVTNVNEVPNGSVTISGTTTRGQTLTAANTLSDADGPATLSVTYQWQANGVDISGATSGTLVLGSDQLGKTITVIAGYLDAGGATERIGSSATAVVANVPNTAPTLALIAVLTDSRILENTNTAAHILVANITVTDDAQGSNTLSLTGADAASFEIVGTALYLKAGVVLDFETQTSYQLAVQMSDASLPASTPAPAGFTLTVVNVEEGTPVTPQPDPVPVLPPVTQWPSLPDNDNDGDGTPEALEDFVKSLDVTGAVAGDGNGDGIADAKQQSVASVPFLKTPTAISSPGNAPPVFISLVADSRDGKPDTTDANTAQLQNVVQKDAPVNLPAAVKMPLGLISFDAVVGLSGTAGIGVTETFSLYVDSTLGINGYWKLDASSTWVNLASSVYGGAIVTEGGKTRLDFKITDGGQFDADHTVNGTIEDPGAAGFVPLSMVGYAPDTWISLVGYAPDLPTGGFWF